MSSKQFASGERSRMRLLEMWRGKSEFGHAIGCVTTTFTFDAELFEEQCLARFLSIQSNPNETAKAYLVEREEKLSQCFTCVLVDQKHASAERSLRWNLMPVRLPSGGVLHAKLTILVWEKCIRVLVGSANLTEPGYRRNQEVMAAFNFSEQDNPPIQLLTESIGFLKQVSRYAPGSEQRSNGPKIALKEFLKLIDQRAADLTAGKNKDAECVLIPLVPGGSSVVKQLKDVWKGSAPNKARILSPFFDKEEGYAAATASEFSGLLSPQGKRSLTYVAPGRISLDGTVIIDAPEELRDSPPESVGCAFSIVPQRVDEDGQREDRPLHAKSIWLARDERALYLLGSSNFTGPGLGLGSANNIELNVAYLFKDRASRFAKLCATSWPIDQAVEDAEEAEFLAGPSDSTENLDGAQLPRQFGLALYVRDGREGWLELEIDEGVDDSFSVHSKDSLQILDHKSWLTSRKNGVAVVAWADKRPPSSLEVRWVDAGKAECRATWVVNVSDFSALPPTDELGSLSLSELMEILTSAKPVHEVVTRILERRRKKQESPKPSDELDPHKKVDTSQYLLRRMRRVAHALEGMRVRLEQPVSFVDALRWRLQGPVGPLALARRLSMEEGHGAVFMITEIATTLKEVAWNPQGRLRMKDVNVEVRKTLDELNALANKTTSPRSLAKYVKESFKELLG